MSFLSLFSVPGASGVSGSSVSAAEPRQTASAEATSGGANTRIEQAFTSASQATGLPFDYFMTTAMRESSLDVNAAATTSSARGPFQFIEQTWLSMLHEHGSSLGLDDVAGSIERNSDGRFQVPNPQARESLLAMRHDPQLSAVMSGLYLQENAADLEAGLGRPITVGEGYVAHVFGASGATRLISLAEQQPGRTAADVFPVQAEANRGLFYTREGSSVTLGDLYNRLTEGFSSDTVRQTGVQSAGLNLPQDGSPLSLTPAGFEDLPTAQASYVPAGNDDLAARGMFAATSVTSGSGSTPFFAALYRPEGFGAREIADDLVSTHSQARSNPALADPVLAAPVLAAPMPLASVSDSSADQASIAPTPVVPSPVARPSAMSSALPSAATMGAEPGAPLDLMQFSRTGELAQLYRNPAATASNAELVPPV